jgi:hypothetical protein
MNNPFKINGAVAPQDGFNGKGRHANGQRKAATLDDVLVELQGLAVLLAQLTDDTAVICGLLLEDRDACETAEDVCNECRAREASGAESF